MDPAIIHYSKHNNNNNSYLNEQEFGEYFIGLNNRNNNNKENKNTLNGDKNIVNIDRNNDLNNNESSEILTPLNMNTKLSFTERTVNVFIFYIFFFFLLIQIIQNY